MTCTGCGEPLEDGLRFCTSCGTPVARACPTCGAEARPDQRFCGQCGTALHDTDTSGPRPAVESSAPSEAAAGTGDGGPVRERKVATILFADLVGFTQLGEQADPELVQSLVTRAFDQLSVEVERYEGLIEKFAGDAMLAVFGVPVVHEDDPERAVRAGLEMQRAMGRLADELAGEGHDPLRLRIGIETGEVLVDQARAANQRDRMVTGDPVNTAARLQQAADPGQVVVGASTYAATNALVRYHELEPLQLKGKATAVAAWHAIEVDARRGRTRDRSGLQAPMLGRDTELALLQDTLRRTARDGRPHLVTVLGDAGVGKSRLIWELEKHLDGLPEDWHWRVGRCLAYGQPTYGPIAEVIKTDIGALDDDAPDVVEAKLRARVGELGGSSDVLGALASLLVSEHRGEDVPAGRDQGELFELWQRYLELVARRAPLVLAIEDLHWADDGTLDFIESLARWGEGPVAVVAIGRHELTDVRGSWGGGMTNATTLVLEPLDTATAEALLEQLLGIEVPGHVRERIVATADGNPLFLEELLRGLSDQGLIDRTTGPYEILADLDDLDVPSTIQALLAARVDALPAEDKATLQAAAVVGRAFWTGAVATLTNTTVEETNSALRRLRSKELIVPVAEPALSGETEYTFRHALVRDVAYDALPMSERAIRHVQVAHWARERVGERGDEIAELLATHLLDAVNYATRSPHPDLDLTQLRRDAFEQARRAGQRAASLAQVGAAARWLGHATDLAEDLDLPVDEKVAVIAEHVEALQGHGAVQDTFAEISRARDLAGQGSVPAMTMARIDVAHAERLLSTGDAANARTLLEQRIHETDDIGSRALLRKQLGWVLWRTGEAQRSMAILEQALDEARTVGDARTERWVIHELAMAHNVGGDHERSITLALESMELARSASDHELLTRCHINVPAVLVGTDRRGEGTPITRRGLDHARRALYRHHIAFLASNLGKTLYQAGELDEAEPLYLEGLEAAETLDDQFQITATCHLLARFHLHRGDLETARRWARRFYEHFVPTEVQLRGMDAPLAALIAWHDDPRRGADQLRPTAIVAPEDREGFHAIHARDYLRMAVRLQEQVEAVPMAALEHDRESAPHAGGQAVAEWALALRSQQPDAGVADLQSVAATLETVDEHLWAAETIVDAALIAARHDHPDASLLLGRARARFEEFGAVPLLGPLPEDRWV